MDEECQGADILYGMLRLAGGQMTGDAPRICPPLANNIGVLIKKTRKSMDIMR